MDLGGKNMDYLGVPEDWVEMHSTSVTSLCYAFFVWKVTIYRSNHDGICQKLCTVEGWEWRNSGEGISTFAVKWHSKLRPVFSLKSLKFPPDSVPPAAKEGPTLPDGGQQRVQGSPGLFPGHHRGAQGTQDPGTRDDPASHSVLGCLDRRVIREGKWKVKLRGVSVDRSVTWRWHTP